MFRGSAWLSVLVAAAVCGACSESSDEPAAGTAGLGNGAGYGAGSSSGATSGGAMAGLGGMPASAGTAGSGFASSGAPGGGAAGSGGVAGGGHPPAAGTSPGGGSAVAGSAGLGGAGGDPFGHCAQAPSSLCSPAQTCEAILAYFPPCGSPGAPLDANGCLRADCRADADCGAGERCIVTPLVTTDCVPSELEGCEVYADGTCGCSSTSDCMGRFACVPEDIAPRSADCDLADMACPELGSVEVVLTYYQDDYGDELGIELRASIEDCLTEVRAAQELCNQQP